MALLYSESKSNETMSECLERFISHCTGDTSLLEKFLLECRIDEINQYIKKHNIDVNEALSLIKELHNIG